MNAGDERYQWIARQLLGAAVWLAAALCSPPAANAAWRTWVGDDTAVGGSGTWSESAANTNWSGADAGTAPYYAWVAGDKPKFFAPAGTVTVEGTVKLYSEFYLYDNYVFTGGTIGTTLAITMQPIGTGTTVTFNSDLSTRTGDVTTAWGNLTLNNTGTVIINSDLTQSNFNGDIVPYNGRMILNGDNYSAGTVRQTGTNQFGVFILNGTHHNAGSYTIRADGGFGGAGTVQLTNSTKLVDVQGTLIPGTETQIGTLTIGVGDLRLWATTKAEFQVDLTSGTADKVVVGDLLTYGGALNLHFTGTRTTTVSNQLFQSGSRTGSFASTNVFGVDPTKAIISFSEATGILTYVPLTSRGTVVMIR